MTSDGSSPAPSAPDAPAARIKTLSRRDARRKAFELLFELEQHARQLRGRLEGIQSTLHFGAVSPTKPRVGAFLDSKTSQPGEK